MTARRVAKAMRAAFRADKKRQTLELWSQVLHAYGVNSYYRNQAHNWWGWRL